MCLAIPAQVMELDAEAQMATVAFGEVTRSVSVALLERVAVGDFVLVHVGHAIATVDPGEAEKTLRLFAEAGLIGSSGP